MRAARIDVGDVQRPVRAGVVADVEDFAQVMDGEHRSLPVRDLLGLDAQAAVAEDAAPALANGNDAREADAGGVTQSTSSSSAQAWISRSASPWFSAS